MNYLVELEGRDGRTTVNYLVEADCYGTGNYFVDFTKEKQVIASFAMHLVHVIRVKVEDKAEQPTESYTLREHARDGK